MATLASPRGNSVALLRPLATLLGRVGADGEGFLARLRVDDASPADTYVPDVAVDRALDEIAAARGDETFGLTLARESAARPLLGLFGHLVWLSGTLRDALSRGAQFYALVTHRATLVLDEGARGDPALATFRRHVVAGASRGRILTEYMFASLVLRAREAVGPAFAVRAMRFADRERDPAPYEALFEAPVLFEQGPGALDELSFDAAQLDRPLSGADPFTVAAIEAQVRSLRVGMDAAPFADRVRDAVLAEVRDGHVTLEAIARRLGLGSRALRRTLREEGISLRALVASAQSERARELLSGGASIKSVAFALGFSEPSAFSRAYKRWTGRAPGSAHR